MLDIDKFKSVNDTFGHKAGDIVLRNVAGAVTGRVREEDTVARWGGEEIAVLLRGAGETEAAKIAEELRISIENGGQVTASFGVAEIDPALTLEENIDRADQAMYQAKEGGRNQTVIYRSPETPAII
jgi:diguanylate cyclase (GGDEF)-like protein